MTLTRTAFLLPMLMMFMIITPTAGQMYYNVSNAPFATISNGPQNAVIVDVADPRNPVEVEAAVNAALTRSTFRSAVSPLSKQIAKLREAGLIRPDVEPELYANVLVRSGGTFDGATRATRAYGGGTITFTYTGWSLSDEAMLKSFVQLVYPIVQQIYGSPANTITVNVFNDTAQSEKDSLLGGAYITGSGVQPQIRLWRYANNASLERSFLHMIIRAFHDTAAFNYDAWEEGFNRAACVAAGEEIDKKIAQNPSLGLVKMDFVGRQLSGDAFYYLMSNYEMLNQPPLSNNTFFTSWADTLQGGGLFAGMIIPRLGMSSTAWLKVYIERLRADGESFFRLFNEAYYQQLSGNPGIAGNVPALKGIASSLTPSVEGRAFDDWFRRQYIFDTSVSIGKKLYAFTFPPDVPDSPSTEGYSLPIFLIYYTTTATGDETPLATTIYPVYWDYLYQNDIFLSGQYEMVTVETGEGYVIPTFFVDNLGGSQRIATDFTAGTETVRVYFPAGMTGSTAAPNDFLGVVIGADAGNVGIKVDSDVAGTSTSVIKGAFGASIPSILNFHRLTITYTPPSGSQVIRKVNVGPGTYVTLLHALSAGKVLTHTFQAGMRMISVPMTTFEQDQAKALAGSTGAPAIPADKLLLARWDPLLAGDYKYQMYPRTPPFAPGKGYWVKFPSTTIVTVTGEAPDPSAGIRIGLASGWNQIGGPFESGVPISSLIVEKGNDEPVSFSEAWSTGIIGKVIWKYTPGVGYEQTTTLDPWEGYWIKCNVPDGAVLIVPGPAGMSRMSNPAISHGTGGREASSFDGWSMKLSAATLSGSASTVTLGAAVGATDAFDNAFDAELPPAYGEGIRLVSSVPGGMGEGCAVDTRAADSAKLSWDLIIIPAEPNQDVIVKWQDIGSTPGRYKLTLVDESSGRSQFMRTTSSYRFNSGDGSPRRLRVIADSSPTTRLLVTNIMVGPTRGSSTSFSYNLSNDAQVTAEIADASGRCIRRLEGGRTTRSGINTLSWDRRDDAGHTVPAGVYLLQLTAVDEDGEMAKGIRPVLIAR